jgi:hypothetical protein
VSNKCTHNRETILGSMVFNDFTKITISHTGFD